MSSREVFPDLAAVLSRHRTEIAMNWAEEVRSLPAMHHGDPGLHDPGWAEDGVSALVEYLATGSSVAAERFLERLAALRLRSKLDISEGIEELLLIKEAASPYLHCAGQLASGRCPEQVRQFDAGVRRFITWFCDLYSRRIHEELQEGAALAERHRLARELHDSASQSMYAVTLFSGAAARQLELGRATETAAHLERIRDTALEALGEMRLLIFELHPPVLEEVGLAGALQARLAAVEDRAGLKTVFRVAGEDRPSLPIEKGLLRIGQELLHNVLKHSRARNVEVFLRQSRDEVMLEVTDDGVGFDQAQAGTKGGLGLTGVKERVRELGAVLDIETGVGRGTRVSVRIPLAQAPHETPQ
jgi:signal transduction histidine kinase